MIKKTSYTMKFELSLYHYQIFESHGIYETYIYVCVEYIIHIFINNMENIYEMSTLLAHTILYYYYSKMVSIYINYTSI